MRDKIFTLISYERHRQDHLHPNFYHPLAVLMEEVGEVAKELQEGADTSRLIEELTQVAAVAVRWIEQLDKAEGLRDDRNTRAV